MRCQQVSELHGLLLTVIDCHLCQLSVVAKSDCQQLTKIHRDSATFCKDTRALSNVPIHRCASRHSHVAFCLYVNHPARAGMACCCVLVVSHMVQDVMARYARMSGRKTLWLPGTDHAGIATQVGRPWRDHSAAQQSIPCAMVAQHSMG